MIMLIDTEHIHHWMNAIRKSDNCIRTLDAFWRGQISSKEWLIKNLAKSIKEPVDIEIHGGWVGVLASLLFQSDIPVKNIMSLDIDLSCQSIAEEMNRIESNQKRFVAITKDMCEHDPFMDVVINTSCEHITQQQYDVWLDKISTNQIIVLQSNDYVIDEHIRIARNLDEFIGQSRLSEVLYSGELELPLYKRFMIIGRK